VIEEMEWFRRRGHAVWLGAREKSGIRQLAAQRDLPFIPTPFRGSISPTATAQIFRACRRLDVNLLLTRNSRDTSCAWPVAEILRLPLVRYQHICKKLKEGLLQKVLWRCAPDQIISVSQSIKNRLIDQNLADEKSICVIGEFVDRRKYHPAVSSGDVRARYGIPADATVIINVGMFRQDKGQALLLDEAGAILRARPDCWFMLVGDGLDAYGDVLREKIRQSPHAGRFVLTGFQSDTAAHIAASDLVCLTSKLEAQSKVIPQAFAMGKLVVAPDIGGIRELVRDRENGLIYSRSQPGALAEALDAAFHIDRKKLTLNAQADAEQLDLDKVMERTEALYTSLVQ